MSFLSPWLLLGAAGVAVPIVVHLLSRYRHRRLEWAAMELLRRAVRVKTRRIRLEDLLLLMLRCLIVLLVVFALARPTTRGVSAFGDPDAGMVVAVDGSLSMANLADGVPRFQRATDKARDILNTARPGDPTSLMVVGAEPQVLLRNTGYQRDRVDEALAQLEARPEAINLEATLEEAAAMLEDMTAANTELYLVTDAQHTTWANLSDRSRRLLRSIAAEHRVFLVPVRDEVADNIAVTGFELTSGGLRQGELVRLTARVRNFGPTARRGLRVSLLDGDRIVDRTIVTTLGPGESAAVPFFHRLTRPGAVELTARIEGDRLAWDNQRHAVLNVHQQVRVLVADGDPMGTGLGGAADFITRALSPNQGDMASSLTVTSVPLVSLPSVALRDYDLVVLANVPDVPEVIVESLYHFVREGGGLIIYLGDQVQPRVLNKRLVQGDRRLLPAELQRVRAHAGSEADAARIDPDIPNDPVVGVLSVFPAETVAASRFFKHMAVEVPPGSRSLLKLSGGDPLLVERRVGRGAVLMFTTSADRSWNNMALSPVSPALLHQATTHLIRLPHERPVTVGERFVLPMPDTPAGQSVSIMTPDGAAVTHQTILRDGEVVLDIAGLESLGFHRVAVDGQPVGPLAVNADATESDIRASSPAELAAALDDLPVRIIETGADVASTIQQARIGRELWKYLLAAALIALILESIVAKRYARRPKV